MGSKRLQNAAAAAGFAMVNPDDFAAETAVKPVEHPVEPAPQPAESAKTWFSWDMTRLTGPKATA